MSASRSRFHRYSHDLQPAPCTKSFFHFAVHSHRPSKLPTMLAEVPVAGPPPSTFHFTSKDIDVRQDKSEALLGMDILSDALELDINPFPETEQPVVEVTPAPAPAPPPAPAPAPMALRAPMTLVTRPRRRTGFLDLPVEIHEAILDHLFGVRASTSSSAARGSQATRGWSTVLRHPRRKQLSNLALVVPLWCQLVQERLYRHRKCLVPPLSTGPPG